MPRPGQFLGMTHRMCQRAKMRPFRKFCTVISLSSCFRVLRQIRCIHCSLPREALSMLVTLYITSKIDNCNVAQAGLPQRDLDRIQSVLNAAARFTADARKFDHVTPVLVNLHWLCVPDRIQYKLCILVHSCLNGVALQYLSELIQSLSEIDSHRQLRLKFWWPATRHSAIGDSALAAAGPRAWNNLPVDLRLSESFSTFKTHLKSHLFNISFPSV